MTQLPDVQARSDERNLAINQVGVAEVRLPVIIDEPSFESLGGEAMVSLRASLGADQKGTHMSRMVALLGTQPTKINTATLFHTCEELRQTVGCEQTFIDVTTRGFRIKHAPISNHAGWMDYGLQYTVSTGKESTALTSVIVPVKTLCPCSKDISEYGAHNQRSHVTITLPGTTPPIGTAVDVAESSASSQLYSVLKREDEKFVTQKAYENPRFVEDLIREVALGLLHAGIEKFKIKVENFESIHNHDAVAIIDQLA